MEKSLEFIDLFSINEITNLEKDLCFYIADYQRGYRWDKMQVEQLLNDIRDNPFEKVYCLQPVMVVPKNYGTTNKKYFEVIDGQQRLTTLYIILVVLNKFGFQSNLPFDIDYATRKSCIEFLKNLHKLKFVDKESEIEVAWEKIESQNKNVDNFHLHNTYQIINLWFKKNENINILEFDQKIRNDIKIIWYPVIISENSNEKKLFRNINSGKIRLTSSDLIKALFVLDFQNKDETIANKNIKKLEFSNKWNEIERQLNKDDFWFFISNDQSDKYSTRIAFLFDIVTKSFSDNKYESYSKYRDKEYRLDWEVIIDIYQKINEWFSDEKYYHRIGFLINAKIIDFSKIVECYIQTREEKKPKSYFFRKLDYKVKHYFRSKDLNSINYEDNRIACKNILLLYNIFLYESDFPKQKFPFDKFVNETWSIEHIHPQNPQDFSNIEDVRFWLTDTKKTLTQKQSENLPVLQRIEEFLIELDENPVLKYTKIRKEKIKEIKDLLETEISTHKLGNLTLLDRNTNSKVGNGLFRNKRDVILKIDKPNFQNYVPYATVNCFLKRFTNVENLQNEFWSESDSDSYLKNIKEILNGK